MGDNPTVNAMHCSSALRNITGVTEKKQCFKNKFKADKLNFTSGQCFRPGQ